MPQGLDEQMTRAELADLIAFLKATRWGAQIANSQFPNSQPPLPEQSAKLGIGNWKLWAGLTTELSSALDALLHVLGGLQVSE